MIDHPSQLAHLEAYSSITGHSIQIFIKLDTGYHRAGIDSVDNDESRLLLSQVRRGEGAGYCTLQGFYSHAGHSYDGNSPDDALLLLKTEIERTLSFTNFASETFFKSQQRKFIISVGATPTASSIQNILSAKEQSVEASELSDIITRAKELYTVELHAGVYTLLDLQQLATAARPTQFSVDGSETYLSHNNLALTIMVEVASLYEYRERPEALIAAGSLALGREPCKLYSGWGAVTNWNRTDGHQLKNEPPTKWIVGRISQEHGILTPDEPWQLPIPFVTGQKLRVWPNHACIAGAGFGWYFVVDSSRKGHEDEVVDIWVRWRGW